MSVNCDRCGFTNPPELTRCQKCGSGLPVKEIQAPPVVQAPQGQPNPQGGNVVVNVNSPQAAPVPPTPAVAPVVHKSRIVAALLTFFCGIFGLHNYYLGYKGIALLQLILGLFCFYVIPRLYYESGEDVYATLLPLGWAMVDLYLILKGKKKEANGLELKWT